MVGYYSLWNFKSRYTKRDKGHAGSLRGKVVILFGENSELIATLIISLAKKGADISVVCNKTSQRALTYLSRKVQDMGHYLYFVEVGLQETTDSVEPISTVMDKFGRVDALIDLSPQASGRSDLSA